MGYKYNRELLDDAIDCYGEEVVQSVIDMVEMSDPDGAYTTFEDFGWWEYAECLELLYFNS